MNDDEIDDNEMNDNEMNDNEMNDNEMNDDDEMMDAIDAVIPLMGGVQALRGYEMITAIRGISLAHFYCVRWLDGHGEWVENAFERLESVDETDREG